MSAVVNLPGAILDLPTGVMETTMYTQSQFVTIAMEAPLFLDRLELISEGYRNGMARKERPCGSVSSATQSDRRITHIEEVVEEYKAHCDSVGNITSDSKSCRCYRKAH